MLPWILNFKVIFKVIKVKIPLFVLLLNLHIDEHIIRAFVWKYFCYDILMYLLIRCVGLLDNSTQKCDFLRMCFKVNVCFLYSAK